MSGYLEFFIYDIVGRFVAAYLCVDCYRELRLGLIERKIRFFQPSVVVLLLGLQRDAYRDTAPFFYWTQMWTRAGLMLACLFVAVFGWWHPGADGMHTGIQAAWMAVIVYIALSGSWHRWRDSRPSS